MKEQDHSMTHNVARVVEVEEFVVNFEQHPYFIYDISAHMLFPEKFQYFLESSLR